MFSDLTYCIDSILGVVAPGILSITLQTDEMKKWRICYDI